MRFDTGVPQIRAHAPMLSRIKLAVNNLLGELGYKIVRVRHDDEIVSAAKAHLAAASAKSTDLPPLGERWGAYTKRLRSLIAELTTAEDLLAQAQSAAAGVETHLDPVLLRQECRNFHLNMMTSLPPDLLEAFSSFQSPRLAVHKIEYLGRKLDFVSLCAIQTVLSLLHVLPCRPNKICDLGGGTGKYAYAWLTNTAHQPKLIVIVDLAETLVYSETLLRREFGDRVQYLTGPTEHPNSSGIVLCPVANIEAIRSLRFDLVTNVGSMQEMSDKWVDWYMEWLDRQPCSYLYSSNYFGQPLDSMHEGHNSWSPRPSPSWRLVKSNITPGPRIGADMLFVRDNAQSELKTPSGRTLQAWLDHLELARCRRDEASYRQALAFAETLPYTPKEAWQVARMLAQVTGATADREYFERLDQQRRDGFEARH